jgi:hypothetical protein
MDHYFSHFFTIASNKREFFLSHDEKKTRCVLGKTFPENWDSKAPSVGTLLAYLETKA